MRYKIGKCIFSVELPDDLPIPENMSLFIYEGDKKPSVNYRIREEFFDHAVIQKVWDAFAPTNVIRRDDRMILQKEDRECWLLFFRGADTPYGIYQEKEDDVIEILIDSSMRHMMIYDTVFLALFSLEKQMIKDDVLILHCAYMLREGKAVLFSAPSETGKSTQADLWKKYRGTRTINGDRALLYRHEDGWYAHGWPICGSSEICNNEAYPVEAIVMLYQAQENTIETLRGAASLRKVMPQITINRWNLDFVQKAMDLIEELIGEVPVYELGCDISEEAVACLEKELK